ncbi:hypothetical protein AAVH_07475 [Aphelenchoides avenae]|nr:hypothetical protein AAVH_07475 [Aphelenchus avenae]
MAGIRSRRRAATNINIQLGMDSKANEALAKSVEAPSGSQQPAVPSKEKRARKKATETIEAKPQLSSSAVKKNQNAASVDDRASYVPNGQAAQNAIGNPPAAYANQAQVSAPAVSFASLMNVAPHDQQQPEVYYTQSSSFPATSGSFPSGAIVVQSGTVGMQPSGSNAGVTLAPLQNVAPPDQYYQLQQQQEHTAYPYSSDYGMAQPALAPPQPTDGQNPWNAYESAARVATQAINSMAAAGPPCGMLTYNNAIAAAAIAAATATSLLLTGSLEQAIQHQQHPQVYPPHGVMVQLPTHPGASAPNVLHDQPGPSGIVTAAPPAKGSARGKGKRGAQTASRSGKKPKREVMSPEL